MNLLQQRRQEQEAEFRKNGIFGPFSVPRLLWWTAVVWWIVTFVGCYVDATNRPPTHWNIICTIFSAMLSAVIGVKFWQTVNAPFYVEKDKTDEASPQQRDLFS